MKKGTLTMRTVIDAGIFRNFAVFDTFIHQKRWRLPVAFALLMSAFGGICFAFQGRESQAWLLGAMLLALGWGLPFCYVLSFLLSVQGQIKRLNIQKPKPVYTLALSAEGVEASNGKEKVNYSWPDIHMVYVRKRCAYLYVAPGKAYLLPYNQVEGGKEALDVFWQAYAGDKKRR